MKGIMLKIRVLLEGFFLWFGGSGLYFMLMIYVEPHMKDRHGEDILHIVTGIVLFAAASWILVERKKDLGDRISHAAYVVLSIIIPLAVCVTSVCLYIGAMD